MLFRDDSKAKPFNASRYTDHRTEEPKPREERIRLNVNNCIGKLDPNDEHHKHSYKATYKAIMGRNRPEEEDHAEFDEDGTGNNSIHDGQD